MYLLDLVYSVLAFAEILVLVASATALVVKAIDAASARTGPHVKSWNPFKVVVQSRPRKIPGGHNEVF
jgi:hypothetical protein